LQALLPQFKFAKTDLKFEYFVFYLINLVLRPRDRKSNCRRYSFFLIAKRFFTNNRERDLQKKFKNKSAMSFVRQGLLSQRALFYRSWFFFTKT